MPEINVEGLTNDQKRYLDIVKAKRQYCSWREMLLDLTNYNNKEKEQTKKENNSQTPTSQEKNIA